MPQYHTGPPRPHLGAASIYLLEQMAKPDALIVFSTHSKSDNGEVFGHYYYERHCEHFIVQERVMDALSRAGMIKREPGSPVPIYRVTPKGVQYLSR
jgi:hypothetical protein